MAHQYTDRDIELEADMQRLGRERYAGKVARARADGRETDTKAGRWLLANAVGRAEKGLKRWLKETNEAKAPACFPFLKMVPAPRAAVIATKVVLDAACSRRGYASVAAQIGRELEDEAFFRSVKKGAAPLWRKTIEKAGKDKRRRSRSTRMKRAMLEAGATDLAWPLKARHQAGAILLEVVVKHTSLVLVAPAGTTHRPRATVITPTAALLQWLEQSHQEHAELHPLYLPMVNPPASWDSVRGGGYLTACVRHTPLVRTPHLSHLTAIEAAAPAPVFRAVNLLQSTAWRVNRPVLKVATALHLEGAAVAGLPRRNDDPLPPLPDLPRGSPEWKAVRQRRAIAHEANQYHRAARLQVLRTFGVARRFEIEDVLYFPHTLDFRGRAYPVPNFLQPQGDDLAVGLLEFAQSSSVEWTSGTTETEWFLVHGANCFGHDKLPWSERVKWAESHEMKVLAARIWMDPKGTVEWWGQADKPFQFLAWCLEAHVFFSAGKVASRLPVLMDGSNNGLQIYSLLFKDTPGARATNCAPSDKPEDIYMDVARTASATLIGLAAGGDQMARRWLAFLPNNLPRVATKRTVMTMPYGSTLFAAQKYIGDWYDAECVRLGFRPFTNDRYQAVCYLAKIVWAAIAESVPAARRGMDWLRKLADVCSEHGVAASWTVPTGFPVVQRYPRMRACQIRTLVMGSVRRPSFNIPSAGIDPKRQRNGLPPNYVHSLDAAVLAQALTLAADRGIMAVRAVHDGYGVHASQAPLMARCIREAYATMFSLPLLDRLCEDLSSLLPPGTSLPPPPAPGDFDVNDVLRSAYFFS